MNLVDRFTPSALIESLLAQNIVQGDQDVAKALSVVGKLIQFETGEVLIREGEFDRDMYFILYGIVTVSVKGKVIGSRQKNSTIGEMSAVNHSIARSATITANEPVVTLKITPDDLEKIASSHFKVYRLIAADLAARLLQRNDLIRAPNSRPRVFFISSKESLPVAKAIRFGLNYTEADSIIWSDEDIFPPGAYPLETLENEVNKADFGVAIAHPDDIVRSRSKESAAPRDNVIFELGFFMSRLGRERTFLLVPKMSEELKLPSDFKGMVPITYTPLKNSKDEVASQVLSGPTYTLEQKITKLGCREL